MPSIPVHDTGLVSAVPVITIDSDDDDDSTPDMDDDDEDGLEEDEYDSGQFAENAEQNFGEIEVTDGISGIKRHLHAIISAQHAFGSFALANTCPDAVNPHLFVKGLGNVGVPVSDRDARAIIERCHQSPYGKGGETLVDTSVRKTWELNADQFELRNPAWTAFLKRLVKKVADGLGVIAGPDAIEPKPYKLLVYEEGAMFKPHTE
jgi:hypothetical protein